MPTVHMKNSIYIPSTESLDVSLHNATKRYRHKNVVTAMAVD